MSIWTRIADAFKPRVVVTGESVIPQQSLWEQQDRIGGNLTPAGVSTILLQADTGDTRRRVSLANECRQRDGHLHSTLSTREIALSTTPWCIEAHLEPGKQDPKRRDAKIAEFCEEAIRKATGDGQEDRSFDDAIEHLQGGVYHGFANAETLWHKDGASIVPRAWRLHNQRRFVFREADGRLVWSDVFGTRHGVDLMADYPGQFVQHIPRVNGDVLQREGLSTLLVWCALFRNWPISDWLKTAELSWKPWRVGKITKTGGDEDQKSLIRILERLTTGGIAVLGPNQELELGKNGVGDGRGGAGNHERLCMFMGAEMSKAVLGQTLTTEAGERGARSLGEVHDRVRKDIRDRDAKALASTINRDLIRPLVELNFGANVPVPRFEFVTDDALDLGEFGTALGALRTAGMRVPERWAHDQAGVPIPAEDEPCLGDADEDDDDDGSVDVDTSELDGKKSPDDGKEDQAD